MDFNVAESVPTLLQHARALGLDEDAAEELVARALTCAIEYADQFEPKIGLENWLIFITDMVACEVVGQPKKHG
ncbi:hypothetical protein [Paracoccus sp. KR1-242]|uniref:hypothetical protein n=1 Tax=Paracoccus sp. KR1-242 TaxID=3410028 RepID=UPI003C0B9EC6